MRRRPRRTRRVRRSPRAHGDSRSAVDARSIWGGRRRPAARLILSGALDRHRRLKIISGHWGEMVPFSLQRMDDTVPRGVTDLARTIGDTYPEQVWVGPSDMLGTPHLLFIREVLGNDWIVFSVDYPHLTLSGAREWLERLPIPQADKEAIASENARRLLQLTVPR